MPIRHVSPGVESFGSLDEFLSMPSVPSGQFTIRLGETPFDLKYQDGGHDTTLVMFHAALGPKVNQLPMFLGQNFSASIAANRLFISDPSLHKDPALRLAWYAGSNEVPDLQESLVRVFRKVTAGKRTLYFGASGGGFAALFYSARHAGSLAVPVNPQIRIGSYIRAAVQNWTDRGWGMSNRVDDSLLLPEQVVTDLIPVYSEATSNHVLYIQNTGDVSHMEKHYAPFASAMNASNSFLPLLGFHGEGHVAPPADFLTNVLESACGTNDWSELQLSKMPIS